MDNGHPKMSAISTARTHATAPVTHPSTNDEPLEPLHDAPKVPPYEASAGGWIGTAAGTLGGGVVGFGLAGAILGGLSFVSRDLGVGAGAFMGALGFGAVIGGAVGGTSTYAHNKNSYLSKAEASQDKQYGTSTLELARKQIAKFDHNHDGSIQLDNASGLQAQDEQQLTQRNNRIDRRRTISAASIWTAADSNPADRVVTDRELARLMSQFDTDKSGSMTTLEQQAFSDAHPLKTSSWRS